MTSRTSKTSRLTLAMAASALLGLAGAAVAAEWQPGQYLASPILGKGALTAQVSAQSAAAALLEEAEWKTNPSRYLPSPIYGAGLVWSVTEEAQEAR